MKIFWIDLFAGAGGTTTGIHLTVEGSEVVACVNHDEKAIASHYANHPMCKHYTEDVRDMKVVRKIAKQVKELRQKYPDAIINIWASLECTNFSNAKGGLPREADSRTLAYALYQYLTEINPDNVFIENVREFLSWGPLDDRGKPVSRLKGADYLQWVDTMKSFGYDYEYRLLNSADYGAHTKRIRYFSQFARKGFPIIWPDPTHSNKKDDGLKDWRPVKEVLDFTDEGESIFTRKKPLVEASLKRIYAGLKKFVDTDEPSFMVKYNSMNQKGYYRPPSLNEPSPVITAQGRLGVASMVRLPLMTSYYGNSKGAQSVEKPCPTLTTKDRFSLWFIDQQYGNGKPASVNQPANTLTTNPKLHPVSVHRWILNPQYNNKGGSLDKPCFTLIARMDKMPPYLMSAAIGSMPHEINLAKDSPTMIAIKLFMYEHGISDIKMRMLLIQEMLKIQGFPEDYILVGTKADQKKQIGNAVVTLVAKALAESNYNAIRELRQAS